MSVLNAIIIDDERRGQQALKEMVETYCDEVNVVGMAGDVESGMELINKVNPDVVFLDIEMPEHSGFNLIERLESLTFDLVFTTAYEQYAIRAFRSGATGYLLKPINIDELVEVMEKVKAKNLNTQNVVNSNNFDRLESIKSNRLIFSTQSEFFFVEPNEILYLNSSDKQTTIYLKNNKEIKTSKPLNTCMEMLKDLPMVRINRNYIINMKYVVEYKKGDGVLMLENDKEISIGRFYKEEVNKLIGFYIK